MCDFFFFFYAPIRTYITRLTIEGLHRKEKYPGRNFDIEFSPGVSVLYGGSGTGKSTILQIIANSVNDDWSKFDIVNFKSVSLDISDGQKNEHIREESGPARVIPTRPNDNLDTTAFRAVYFPELRRLVDVANYIDLPSDIRLRAFGAFLPNFQYHTAADIEASLVSELNDIVSRLAPVQSASVLNDLLAGDPDFQTIERLINAVNEFLYEKEMFWTISEDGGQIYVGITLDGDEFGETAPLSILSVSEREILSMLYETSALGQNDLVIIDKPEMSLTIDFQYDFARTLAGTLIDKQVIICTHSPDILTAFENSAADFRAIEVQSTLAEMEV